jgi:hypothetical protein
MTQRINSMRGIHLVEPMDEGAFPNVWRTTLDVLDGNGDKLLQSFKAILLPVGCGVQVSDEAVHHWAVTFGGSICGGAFAHPGLRFRSSQTE